MSKEGDTDNLEAEVKSGVWSVSLLNSLNLLCASMLLQDNSVEFIAQHQKKTN